MSPRGSKLVDDDDFVDDFGAGFEEAPLEEPDVEEAPVATKKKSKSKAKAGRGVVLEKPRANAYTAMLVLAFVALVIGCLFLSAELKSYDWKIKAR